MWQTLLLSTLAVILCSCTSVGKLPNGKYAVPVSAEVRSPFGTNTAFAKLEICDQVSIPAHSSDPRAAERPGTAYINCEPVTDWVPFSSQGQGGQILSGLLNAAGLVGLGALLPNNTTNVTQSQSQNQAAKGGAGGVGGTGGAGGMGGSGGGSHHGY